MDTGTAVAAERADTERAESVWAGPEWADMKCTVREASPAYGDAEDGDEERSDDDLERFRLRGDPPFTDDEVERMEELVARVGERSAQLHAGDQELLEWIADFDRPKGWKLHGHRNGVDWLEGD